MLVCDLCGSRRSDPVLLSRDRCFGIPGEFPLLSCTDCGLHRLSPRPDPEHLGHYYPAGSYYAYTLPAADGGHEHSVRARAELAVKSAGLASLGYDTGPTAGWARVLVKVGGRRLLRRATYGRRGFPAARRAGRALDVGCGSGAFLLQLQHHGWSVAGVEIDSAAAAVAREKSGAEVHCGELVGAPFAEESFDFVHMSHVIEHVARPLDALQRAALLLKPGGQMYIETPNVESFGFRRCRELWYPLETPRHLWLFSPSTMQMALARSGLHLDKLATAPFPSFRWEATYRREDDEGRPSSRRPAHRTSDLPRIAVMETVNRLLPLWAPRSGDILCCWASKR